MGKFFGKDASQFAIHGDREDIPEAIQADGTLSYEAGFSNKYALDLNTDKDAITISRKQFNQLIYDITSSIGQLQQQGMWEWQPGITYRRGMQVLYGDDAWICKNPNTDSVPSPVNGNWLRCVELFEQIGQSSMYQVWDGSVLTAPSKGTKIFVTGYWKGIATNKVSSPAAITVVVNGIARTLNKVGRRNGGSGHGYYSNFYFAFDHIYTFNYNRGDRINLNIWPNNMEEYALFLMFLG